VPAILLPLPVLPSSFFGSSLMDFVISHHLPHRGQHFVRN
jgi:hypothetical protein